MANDVVKLTWAADGEADEAELNLLDFAQGLTLDDSGWTPQVATGDQATVTETLTFHAKALSHDQLAGYVQVLDDWIMRVNWSNDYTQLQFVWLNARWKSETEIRRAVVYSLAYSLGDASSPFAPYLRDDSFVPTLTIVITRGAYWEDIAFTQISSGAAQQSLTGGEVLFLSNAQPYIGIGDVPARISLLAGALSDNALEEFWFGWRTSRNGIITNFEPVWDMQDAGWLLDIAHGGGVDDTVITADATARSGFKLVTDFSAGATLMTRAAISVSDAAVEVVDQRGMYICLMRAMMSDTSIARVRASSGFSTSAAYYSFIVNPRVTVSQPDSIPEGMDGWFLYNLGLIRIPAIQHEYQSMNLIDEASIIIDAELVSGSGDFEIDCLILIPYNDSYIEANAGGGSTISIMTHPDYGIDAFITPGVKQASVSPAGWSFPANNESPRMIAAGQRISGHNLLDTATFSGNILTRWRTLRGTE